MADIGAIIDAASRTDNINTSGLSIDMVPMTELLDPGDYPMVALNRTMGKKSSSRGQMKAEFRERRLIPNFSTVTTAVTANNTTSLVVQDPTYFKADRILSIPSTGDQLMVDSVSGSTVTVRSLTGTTGSGNIPNAISAGAKVVIGSEAHAEGEEVPAVYSNLSINKHNYIMQSDRRISATDIEEASKHYDSSEQRMADQRKAWIEFNRDMNILVYIGKGTREVTSASGPRRHVCSGVFEQFNENSVDCSQSTFTINTLNSIMQKATPHSTSGTKTGLFGVNGWDKICAWPREYLRETSGADKRWGISLSSIITGYGTLNVGYDPMLNENYGLADRGVVMDLSKIRILHLGNLTPMLKKNIPNLSTAHSTVDAITGTFGLEVRLAELHCQIEGM